MSDVTTPTVISVNVGAAVAVGPRRRRTGIAKHPVAMIDVADPGPKRRGPAGVGYSGVAGDFIGTGRHHGGRDQAVYAVAAEELAHWAAELERELPAGSFGENLTTAGLDVDGAEIGDRWRIGTAVLAVTGPRVPCATFTRHLAVPGWARRFAGRARPGAYLAVVEPGRIARGDAVTVERRGSGLGLPITLRAWMGDLDAARTVHAAGVMSDEAQAELAVIIGRAGR